ncbi:MAG: acyl carrier protein [Alphaproteobacteria bacterium]|jgi:acyl carrier protein|nr:acyl carrier protein [Alphaproteobacteria bacterium]
MKKEEIFNVLKSEIADKAGIHENEVELKSNWVDDLALDSLDHLEFIQFCEKRFDIHISDDVAEKAEIVQDFVNIVYNIIN